MSLKIQFEKIFEKKKKKQVKRFHKKLDKLQTIRPLKLLHIDLIGPMRTQSIGGRRYVLAIVDDFSRFAFVAFLREKLVAFEYFKAINSYI